LGIASALPNALPDELRATGVPLIAYQGSEDPAIGLGRLQAEQAGAAFFIVPGDIRTSFVDSAPVIDGVTQRLARNQH
jgi:hypothetical protein